MPATDDTEHVIHVRSVQVYRGSFTAGFIDEDGNLREYAQDLDFHEEKNLSFECSCGSRFQKWDTATDHLRSVDTDTDRSNTSTEGSR